MPRALLFALSLLGLAAAVAFASAPDGEPTPELVDEARRADRILVEKAERRMTLFRGEEALAVYEIGLGFSPEGQKMREGDGRTPEGLYQIDRRNPRSAYHLSLGLSYPRPDQRAAAQKDRRDPGGDIFIHGQPNRLPAGISIPGDWTAGCIAVADEEMREIWSMVDYGVVVEVRS